MKRTFLIYLFTIAAVSVLAQSRSYEALRDHFADEEDVVSFRLSGFMCRAAINLFAPEEKQFRALMEDVDNIRFMVIPKDHFSSQGFSLSRFRSHLTKDSFEELMNVRDHGDHVTLFHRADGKKNNRYFMLVEDTKEVVAIEMKGYIDPQLLNDKNSKISINKY
jgi:Domain of unknown function (DUF4252)